MEEIYSPPLLKTIMAKAKGRAPFTMKGFSYPGQSPLQDAKQQTMRDLGTAGGREKVEQTRPYGSSGGSGRSWIDTIPSFMGALSGGSGGGGMFGAIAAATRIGSLKLLVEREGMNYPLVPGKIQNQVMFQALHHL